MKALQYSSFGTPDVLEWSDRPDPVAGPGQVVVTLEVAGLNYADIYRRQGRFPSFGNKPWVPGMEGAGTISDLGPDGAAAGLRIGDRVAWCDSPLSSAERVIVAIDNIIELPDSISGQLAASVLLQGLTAHYLVHDSHPLQEGDWCVVHAAGGGVGLLLTQIIKHLGGHVIAIASSPEKQQAAAEAGADEAIGYDDWVARVHTITAGGADVVFDSVGTTIIESLAAARVGGRAVFFGFAGGEPPAVEPAMLMDRSLSLTGGDLWNHVTTAETRRARAAELFDWIQRGAVVPRIARVFDLADGAEAHRYIESRTAIGKILLTR